MFNKNTFINVFCEQIKQIPDTESNSVIGMVFLFGAKYFLDDTFFKNQFEDWITGEQPKTCGNYLVTISDGFSDNINRYVLQVKRVQYPNGEWIWEGNNQSVTVPDKKVIAWKNLPKPYIN